MSPRKKVLIIVILGISACVLSFGLSQYYSRKNQHNLLLLSQVRQLSGKVDYIRLLSQDFIQTGNEKTWQNVLDNLKLLDLDLVGAARAAGGFQRKVENLKAKAKKYQEILTAMHAPAVMVSREKEEIRGIGLSFSTEVEQRIIAPYKKEEALRVYKGKRIDPIKSRVKDTAHEIKGLHLKQQLILTELLLDGDVGAYLRKKETIAQAVQKQRAQLLYLSVLMGDQPAIGETLASLEIKLNQLFDHEKAVLKHFTVLTTLNKDLTTAGEELLGASAGLTADIVRDISDAQWLNNLMSWALLIFILAGLSTVGTLLARDIIRFVEDLRASQAEYRASEKNLEVTLNSLGDAVIATDAGGLVTRMNPMAEKLTGWPSGESLGRPLSEVFRIVNAKTRRTVVNPVEKVLAEGKIVGLANHTVLIARDGQEFQIADSGAPIRHPGGEIIGVVLVFRDVTETYAAEQKIRDSEKRLKNITDNIPVVVYQFKSGPNHEYSSTHISGKSDEIFGMPKDESDRFLQFTAGIPDEDKERFLGSIREAVDLMAPWEYEGRYLKQSGDEIWFSAVASPQKIGDEVLFSGVLFDTTERHRMASALRITKFSFDHAAVGIFYIEPDGRVVEANQKAAQMLGYSTSELTGMSIFDIDIAIDHAGRKKMWNRLRETGEDRFESTYRAKDGSELPVEIVRNLFDFENRQFTVAFVQDISERKLAEQENQRLQGALVQAQKMEAIGTLAGGIAHDFNNILSAVIGYSEVSLTMTEVDDPVHQHLEKVLTAGLRARDLVQQILTFSRKHERKLIPLQVGPLVKESLKMLRSTLPATIDISQEIDEHIDNVRADATQVHQIVMNLCTNAAHAMEPDGGKLKVVLTQVSLSHQDTRLHPGLRPGDYLKLSVQDTGRGIPPKDLEKIFDPYFTTKELGKGTGLGLAVVHGIVKSYGGAVYAYSEPGSGTTFNVYLPAVKEKGAEDQEALPELSGGKEHILLVDDEPSLLEVGRLILERYGYRVSTAGGGEAALEMLRQSPREIDLLLTDMTMPKMTGDKLAAEFLKIRPDIPIILSTGYSVKITRDKAIKTGIRTMISKPYVAAELVKAVRKVLDGTN